MSCPRPYAICGAWSWPHEPCWLGGRRGCAGGADSCAAVAGVGGQRSGSGVRGGTPGAGARSAACLSQARSTGAAAGVLCDGHHVVPAGDFSGTVAPAGNRPGCSVGRRVAGVAPGARVSVSRRRLRRHARAVCAVGSVAHLADVREDRGALVIDGFAARTHGAARGVVTGSLRGSGPRDCRLGGGGQRGIESHRLDRRGPHARDQTQRRAVVAADAAVVAAGADFRRARDATGDQRRSAGGASGAARGPGGARCDAGAARGGGGGADQPGVGAAQARIMTWTWFHRLGSPPYVYALAARLTPWFAWPAALLIIGGLWGGLVLAPADYQQGDGFRIIYVHAPSAWMSLMVYTTMAIAAAVGLIWRIKVAHAVAASCAPIGASFTFAALVTGALWGQPMWGTYWEWDPRLTSELILLFLYLGYMGLRAGLEDTQRADRASAVLAVVGVVNVPIIHYSVTWWNSLHQAPSVMRLAKPTMAASMLVPLLMMLLGFTLFFGAVLLVRLRGEVLSRERSASWIREVVSA